MLTLYTEGRIYVVQLYIKAISLDLANVNVKSKKYLVGGGESGGQERQNMRKKEGKEGKGASQVTTTSSQKRIFRLLSLHIHGPSWLMAFLCWDLSLWIIGCHCDDRPRSLFNTRTYCSHLSSSHRWGEGLLLSLRLILSKGLDKSACVWHLSTSFLVPFSFPNPPINALLH